LISVYFKEMLAWWYRLKKGENHGDEVVIVSTLVEGALVSARSACDSIAKCLSLVASQKPGQAPPTLKDLINWASKNPSRVSVTCEKLFKSNWKWFYDLRELRNDIVHLKKRVIIYTDRNQFYLILSKTKGERPTLRTPLFPHLFKMVRKIELFSDKVARVVATDLGFPRQRKKKYVLCCRFNYFIKLFGILVPQHEQDDFLKRSKAPR